MKLLTFTALVAAVCTGTAGAQNAGETPLSEKEKARIAEIVRVTRDEKEITKQKYQRVISLLNTNPCDGVDRDLSDARRAQLAPAIAEQQGLKSVEILQSFSTKGWNIIYVNTHVSDEPFLFYSDNPATSLPVTVWSGAATIMETDEVESWVLKHAPGIPSKLASCFAWHVTLNRDK